MDGNYMVEIGNFQVRSSSQLKSEISYDTFTDTTTLNNYYLSRPNSYKILESFDWGRFNWSKSYIESRFTLAESYKNKVNGLVFLMQEEIYKPSKSPLTSKSTLNKTSYVIEGVTIPAMPANPTDSQEDAYILSLLKAWKALCKRLKKDSVLLGCAAACENDSVWSYMYGSPAINYIAANFNMIYVYGFPDTLAFANGATCSSQYVQSGKKDAKSRINFWRNKGFNGKINYILTTKFKKGIGTTDYAAVKADFISAADAGANIISTYPFINEANNDNLASSRLIKLKNEYEPSACKSISLNFSIV